MNRHRFVMYVSLNRHSRYYEKVSSFCVMFYERASSLFLSAYSPRHKKESCLYCTLIDKVVAFTRRPTMTFFHDRVNPFVWSAPVLSDMFFISPHPYILEYAPIKPPPLTPRHPNACTRFLPQMVPFTKLTEKATRPKQRAVPHPVSQRRNDPQDQRRRVFLTKVKQNGDDRRWDARAQQVPHALYVLILTWLTVDE